jgi:hypothetical protein
MFEPIIWSEIKLEKRSTVIVESEMQIKIPFILKKTKQSRDEF